MVDSVTVVGAVIAVMWVLCYLRLLPVPIMRAWFTIGLIIFILTCSLAAYVLDLLRYVGVSRSWTQWLVAMDCKITFGLVLLWSPHIKVHIDEAKQKWSAIPDGSAVCLNHTSFMDALLFVACGPWIYMTKTKTLMKDSLRRIPIFGLVFDRVGHFPVYFKGSAATDFSVDREKQDEVMRRVTTHVQNKGNLALFPEGIVNKQPRDLKPFRHGSFKVMLDHKMPIYYICTVGNSVTWPATAPVGGFPCDIFVSVHKFEVDYATADAPTIADGLQKAMQAEVTRLWAVADKVNKTRREDPAPEAAAAAPPAAAPVKKD